MPPEAPLSGYQVVDFTSVVAGPWCTRLLADCGADVVKVEDPRVGDVLRFAPPLSDGLSRTFAHFNCGKKSIGLDLKEPEGVDLARRLIAQADIVVENFRPGVMARLGLDYESVATSHPRLIYCSISGFGQSGPMAGTPAYAPVVQALSGFEHVLQRAQGGGEVPLNSAIMVADFVAATYAFAAVQTAVIRRERFGEGAHVDVSLMESMLSMVAIQCQEAQWRNEVRATVFRPTRTRDGFVMIPLVSQRNYLGLLAAIGATDLLDELRGQPFQALIARRRDVLAALEAWAGGRDTAEILDCLDRAGLLCARYRTPAEVLEDAHLHARGSFSSLTDAAGTFKVLNAPFRFFAESFPVGREVARVGQNTDEVLATIGVSDREIAGLRDRRII